MVKIIDAGYKFLDDIDGMAILKKIERAGRVCYKSEELITDDSAKKFVAMILKRGHESVIEHHNISIIVVCNRGVSHEWVRHRIASYSQQSTRYCRSVSKAKTKAETSDEVVTLYESGFSMKKISKMSEGKYTEWEIYKILGISDSKIRTQGSRGLINHEYFKTIDNTEKSYLLGMIMADGNLRSKTDHSHQINISQHKNNSWYIYLMVREFIRQNATRCDDRNNHSITFHSKQLYNDLKSKGIIPNKSKMFGPSEADLLWESIPNNLIPDFLRGFLDGDGNIRFFEQKNPGETNSCNIAWSGPHSLLEKIQLWLSQNFGYDANIIDVSGAKKLKRISITKPDIGRDVLKVLYKNFVFPFGNPIKTCRALEQIEHDFPMAQWGDRQFEVIDVINFHKKPEMWKWAEAIDASEMSYRDQMLHGVSPQFARLVLPIGLKTEIVCTHNLREWRHIFRLRTALAAHPQIREIMVPLLRDFQRMIPVIFDDITIPVMPIGAEA